MDGPFHSICILNSVSSFIIWICHTITSHINVFCMFGSFLCWYINMFYSKWGRRKGRIYCPRKIQKYSSLWQFVLVAAAVSCVHVTILFNVIWHWFKISFSSFFFFTDWDGGVGFVYMCPVLTEFFSVINKMSKKEKLFSINDKCHLRITFISDSVQYSKNVSNDLVLLLTLILQAKYSLLLQNGY